MAHSAFEYVRKFEQHEACLPDTWIVVRIDGRSFHRLTSVHEYEKPNDDRGLDQSKLDALFGGFAPPPDIELD